MALRNALENLAVESKQDDIIAALAGLLTEATFSAEDFATETTLAAAVVLLGTIDADTSNLDVSLSTRASESTVASLLTEATFTAEDFATETTLTAAAVLLTSLDGKDFATQTTLAAILADLQLKADKTEAQPIEGGNPTDVAVTLDGETVVLSAATISALQQISNFPADYPLPSAQIATLTPQIDALTQAELVLTLLDRSQNNDPAAIPLTADTAQITSASPLTVTPAAGNAIRLWWVSAIGDPDNPATGVVTVTLAPHGTVYRAPAVAHRQRFDGDADEALTVAVLGSGTFEATVHYEEFTP